MTKRNRRRRKNKAQTEKVSVKDVNSKTCTPTYDGGKEQKSNSVDVSNISFQNESGRCENKMERFCEEDENWTGDVKSEIPSSLVSDSLQDELKSNLDSEKEKTSNCDSKKWNEFYYDEDIDCSDRENSENESYLFYNMPYDIKNNAFEMEELTDYESLLNYGKLNSDQRNVLINYYTRNGIPCDPLRNRSPNLLQRNSDHQFGKITNSDVEFYSNIDINIQQNEKLRNIGCNNEVSLNNGITISKRKKRKRRRKKNKAQTEKVSVKDVNSKTCTPTYDGGKEQKSNSVDVSNISFQNESGRCEKKMERFREEDENWMGDVKSDLDSEKEKMELQRIDYKKWNEINYDEDIDCNDSENSENESYLFYNMPYDIKNNTFETEELIDYESQLNYGNNARRRQTDRINTDRRNINYYTETGIQISEGNYLCPIVLPRNKSPSLLQRSLDHQIGKVTNSDVEFSSNIDTNIQQNENLRNIGCSKEVSLNNGINLTDAESFSNKRIYDEFNQNLICELEEAVDSFSELYSSVNENLMRYKLLRNSYFGKESKWINDNKEESLQDLFNNCLPKDFKRILFFASDVSDSELCSIIDRNALECDTIKNKFSYESDSLDKYMFDKFKNEFLSCSTKFEFCSDMIKKVREYEDSKKNFKEECSKWKKQRKSTLSKLKSLAQTVHDHQLNFNKANLYLKKANTVTREVKTINNSIADFLGTWGTLATDAIGGISSAFQAMNSDSHMKTFGEIMENDIEFTKQFYAMRSESFAAYKNVEEIIRRYDSDTFGSTVKNIYESLSVEVSNSMKASSGNGLVEYCDGIDNFFRQESVKQAWKSVENYMESNPAALNACESAGRTLVGVCDTLSSRGKIVGVGRSLVPTIVNREFIRKNLLEINSLQCMVEEEHMPQARLESKILEAIEDFEAELEDMETFFSSFCLVSEKVAEFRSRLEKIRTGYKNELEKLEITLRKELNVFKNKLKELKSILKEERNRRLAEIRKLNHLNLSLKDSLTDLKSRVCLRNFADMSVFIIPWLFFQIAVI